MLHFLANRKFFHVLHGREGLNIKLLNAVQNVLPALRKYFDVLRKFLWVKMGLAVISGPQHMFTFLDLTCCRMQLMLQSSIADAIIEVFSKEIYVLIILDLPTAAIPNAVPELSKLTVCSTAVLSDLYDIFD